MKLRLRENSIRLRLLQSEIKQLQENGLVAESIQFSPLQTLIYKLQISEEVKELSAEFHASEVTIKIPLGDAQNWINTNQVGLEIDQKVNGEKSLKILIEKDFVCLDRPMDADNLDAFPHPKMKC